MTQKKKFRKVVEWKQRDEHLIVSINCIASTWIAVFLYAIFVKSLTEIILLFGLAIFIQFIFIWSHSGWKKEHWEEIR